MSSLGSTWLAAMSALLGACSARVRASGAPDAIAAAAAAAASAAAAAAAADAAAAVAAAVATAVALQSSYATPRGAWAAAAGRRMSQPRWGPQQRLRMWLLGSPLASNSHSPIEALSPAHSRSAGLQP
mmetsp:Transcript_3323/g.9282  ORF Transcript_3323/g.9282 Transcript_3323/m.9282 type:complete len:128 (-) Transcript_3323:316-699(-)